MFQARAFSAGSVTNSPVHHVLKHPSLCRTVQTANGDQHLLFKDSGQFLQLFVQGADPAKPVHLLTEALLSPSLLKHQLHMLEYFNVLYSSGISRRRQNSARAPSQRLYISLRVLDGRLAGASYREIAVALFGPDRVDKDWNAPGEHLKNRIRRAAQSGAILMQGGYRALLK